MTSKSTQPFHIRPATIDDIPLVINNITEEGDSDIRKHHLNPILSIALDVIESESYIALTEEGNPLGLFGFFGDCFWLHICKEMANHPLAAIKFFRKWLKTQNKPYLWGHVRIEQTATLRMAKMLGFKILRIFPDTYNQTFQVETVRLWIF